VTIRPRHGPAPAPDDDQHPNAAGRTIPGSYPHKMIFTCGQLRSPRRDERHDKRQGLLNLAGRILSSWGYTARMLAVLGVLFGLALLGIGLLRINVDVGPVHVGRVTTQK
jgi:hypothetical protein